jgi:hypothetical protein
MDTATRPADPTLYERDFHAWCVEQASRLRRRARPGANDELDYEHLAEEIEGLARSDKHAIRSHMQNLLLHLLKWQYQPKRRSRSWDRSITSARDQIEALVEYSPSLAPFPGEVMAKVYPKAVRDAAKETGIARRDFPATSPFTAEQVLDPDFMPAGHERE